MKKNIIFSAILATITSHTHTAEQEMEFKGPGRYERFFNDWDRVNELIRTSHRHVFKNLQSFFETYEEECLNNPNLLDLFMATAKTAGNERLCIALLRFKESLNLTKSVTVE